MIALSLGAVVAGVALARVVARRKRPPAGPPPDMEWRRGGCGGNPDVTD